MSILAFEPEPRSKQPLYEQIYRHIRQEIEGQNLRDGDKLPSKRILAGSLKVSLITIEGAYEQLIAEGYIRSSERSGYFVQDLTVQPKQIKAAKDDPIPSARADEPAEPAYDLGTNRVETDGFPFATWARISRQTLKDENRDLLNEVHPQGLYQLRASIAGHLYRHRGIRCDPGQIIIGAGSEYLVSAIVQLLGRDLRYAVENPGYRKIERLLRGQGLQVGHIGLDNQGLALDQLKESQADVIHITPSHQFPTGIVMPASRRLQLLTWASETSNRFIIEDDYDSEFRFAGRPIPAMQSMDKNGCVLYLGTFSKSIAPSIRISYLVLPEDLIERYQQILGFSSSTVSRFEQATLNRFIEEGHFDRHLNRMRKLYRDRRDCLIRAIDAWPFRSQIDVSGSDSGLHLLLSIRQKDLADELIRLARIHSVRLNGYTDKKSTMILLGYAHLDLEKLATAAALLAQAWKTFFLHH